VGTTRTIVNRVELLRRLADRPAAQALIQSTRAAKTLQSPGRLFVAQATRNGRTGAYRLRDDGLRVLLRHRTRDIVVLNEIFGRYKYEPPADAPLDGPLSIIDLGGNVGLFGSWALRRWNVRRLVSFEADPANYRLLRAAAAPHRQWQTVAAAASSQAGSMRFITGRYSESRATGDDEPGVAVPAVDLFAELSESVDLMKIDIEGSEWPILQDPRFAELDARVIVIEWHERHCPSPPAEHFAVRLLRKAGFSEVITRPGRFASNGIIWAWR